jgi:glycosyltransferase involved in cell wall biosynthesis
VKKNRILYISSVVPSTLCGADLAIYRHLVIRNDYEVAVASINAHNAVNDHKFFIRTPRLFLLIKKLGFIRLFANFEYIINWFFFPPGLLDFARKFNPDIILTVPDSYHTGYAYLLAKKLKIPLAVNFQDLTPLSQFFSKETAPYNRTRNFLMKKYHFIHDKADLVFYTSEGMKQYFGHHKNGHVLYPLGDLKEPEKSEDTRTLNKPVEIVYAGNCYGAYGRMLLRFAKAVKNSETIKLKIFPVGKGWTDEEIKEMTDAGIYQSFKPFAELIKDFKRADAFLTAMSFEDPEKTFVKTSFTTKWLDYAPYGKPIFVWGPEYSSGVVFATKYDCGIIVKHDNAEMLKDTVYNLAEDPERWNYYGKQAHHVSREVLNAEKIHSVFKTEINKLI